MRNSFLVLLILLFFSACSPIPDCELNGEFELCIISDAYDAYALYVDGAHITDVEALETVVLELRSGYHEIYMEQLEGFHRYPNTELFQIVGRDCEYVEWIFPYG